jgi:CDP-4-dehydro-6-deoxyglucose reductase, E1
MKPKKHSSSKIRVMIKLIKSTFFREEETKKDLCKFIAAAKQLSIGKECEKFEKRFAKWHGKKYSVLFNSGSSANLALIQSLLNMGKLEAGMRVGFSGITWATNVMPIMQLGLVPVPIDIEIKSLNISLSTLSKVHEKKKIDCLFITNLLGFCDNLLEIKKYCKQQKILLIEDNCEALGSVASGIKLGNFGYASTFSLFVGHHMSAIEGGIVLTDDKLLNRNLRMVRSHGWDRHLSETEQRSLRRASRVSDFEAKYTFYDLAYNLRPTEITGFLGNNQLKYLRDTVKKRQTNFEKFMSILDHQTWFYPLEVKMDIISNFAMPIVCRSKKIKEACVELCEKRGIEVRPIVGGVMSDQPFFKKYIKENFDLPNSRLVHDQGLYFANNPELTEKEINYILATFNLLFQTKLR